LRISGAAGSTSADGKRASGKGRCLLTEPNSIGISPEQTTHPTRIKASSSTIAARATLFQSRRAFRHLA